MPADRAASSEKRRNTRSAGGTSPALGSRGRGSDQPIVAELEAQPIGDGLVRVDVTAAAFTYFDAFVPAHRHGQGMGVPRRFSPPDADDISTVFLDSQVPDGRSRQFDEGDVEVILNRFGTEPVHLFDMVLIVSVGQGCEVRLAPGEQPALASSGDETAVTSSKKCQVTPVN